MSDFLPRIKTDELPALRVLWPVGVPLLMVVFSVAVPALRNPVFLMIGALVGFLLPGGSRFSWFALVGLVLAAVSLALVTLVQH